MARASTTYSPLANPQTPVHRLAGRFQEHLFLPDPNPIYVVAGVIAANMFDGPSVWLMIVGPPSCGGTAILMSLYGADGIRDAGSFSEAALLSGVKQKDLEVGARGGLLREMEINGYGRGVLCVEDFTSIMSMGIDQLKKVLGAMRQVYNGHYSRDVGTGGGKKMVWDGQVGVIAKTTEAIDDPRNMATAGDMGERFVYYRWPASDGWAESRRALSNGTMRDTRWKMRKAVDEFLEEIGVDWTGGYKKRRLLDWETARLIAIAQLGARARSIVRRDPYTRQITGVAQGEMPMRIAGVLAQLFLGMEWIGVEEEVGWQIVRQIALDSMTLTRREIMFQVKAGVTDSVEVAKRLMIGSLAAKQACEDLQAQGVLERRAEGGWRVSGWTAERFERGWA